MLVLKHFSIKSNVSAQTAEEGGWIQRKVSNCVSAGCCGMRDTLHSVCWDSSDFQQWCRMIGWQQQCIN